MRLDKFVCKSSGFSKSEAFALIQQGVVTVNGATVTDVKKQVHLNNVVLLDGEPLQLRPFRYIMLNKPANTICSNKDEFYPSIFRCLNIDHPAELHVAGRLDADSTGLVLITDDGHWSFNIMQPARQCKKVYRVKLSRPLAGGAEDAFKSGILLQGESSLTLPAELEVLGDKEVLVTLVEGRFHQVKRMFAAIGNRVIDLHRLQIGSVQLDQAQGQWRYLTPEEVLALSVTG